MCASPSMACPNVSTRRYAFNIGDLNVILYRLKNTQREDIVFLCFNIWVLGMSFVALLNESIPHIVAALLTHVLATMWSGFQIANTQDFRRNFITLTADGACKGVNLLPNYWKDRGVAEVGLFLISRRASY